LVRALCPHEQVEILAGQGEVADEARRLVGELPQVRIHDVPTNDAWIRDHGPMFLVGGPGDEPALIDWEYNAWGGKYPPFDRDNVVPRRVAEITGRRRFEAGIILEGGAVDFNGHGSVLTSEQCLLNPNRNASLGRAEIERYLADYCAATNVLWLGDGIVGDDTDGHIDELARFVGPRTVVAAVERDPRDENHAPLADNLQRLKSMRDEQGRSLEVIEIPLPGRLMHGEQRLPASYMNFYIANGVVIVPTFDDPNDRLAQETLARLLPTRQVVPIRAVDLAWGLGAFHCITQQEPALTH
jgi:agmatine deiminase